MKISDEEFKAAALEVLKRIRTVHPEDDVPTGRAAMYLALSELDNPVLGLLGIFGASLQSIETLGIPKTAFIEALIYRLETPEEEYRKQTQARFS